MLNTNGLIDSVLSAGQKTGYNFATTSVANSVAYQTTAAPVSASTGTRGFFSDETNVIRGKAGTTAAAVTDPPIQQANEDCAQPLRVGRRRVRMLCPTPLA